ncbi:PH domain-containing protein [Levilactobacillus lanxiensis]|uniref:PH domain-containing protein n=1 Tax=Levilactobacillus lanxiensis TaxID=2799568 RepID=A0ABW4D7N7_9LACO|nr:MULTISPECIES: PH domain-containing protein [Levilactobacillus]
MEQPQTHQLPPRIKRIWGFSALGSLLALLVLDGLIWLAYKFWDWPLWLVIFFLILTVIEPTIETGLIPYRYRFTRYQITDLAVEMQAGFIFQKRVAIPIARVQNVTLNAGPLLQWQKLTKVSIATAATSHDIEGLELPEAERLREQIMRLAQEARHDQA